MNSLSRSLLAVVALTIINVVTATGEPYFSYVNFNPLMLMRDNWYLYYFSFIAIPVVSFATALVMLRRLLTDSWQGTYPLTRTVHLMAKLLYAALIANLLLLAFLTAAPLLNL